MIPHFTLKAKGFYQFQVIIQTEFNQIYDSVLQNNLIAVNISNDDYISIDIEYDSKIV